jgi:hypothetical protein
MKKKLPEYDHNVIDAYDFLVDKSLPVANQVKYIVTDDNLLEPTNEPIYGDIKPLFSNGAFENNEPTQFNGRLNGTSSKDLMIHIFNSVEVLTEEHGKLLKKWADGGIPAVKPEVITPEQVQEILTLCDSRGLDPAEVLLKSKLKNGFASCPVEKFDNLIAFISSLTSEIV